MTDYDSQVRSLLAAGFTDDQVNALIEMFEPLKVQKDVKQKMCKYTQMDLMAAHHIFKQIRDKFPETQEPNFDQWAGDLRKLRELDKIEPNKIAEVFTWAHNHHFWSANIRSPAKLRKQWEQLCAQKQQESENGRNQHI